MSGKTKAVLDAELRLANATSALASFERQQRDLGGSYRDSNGNYSASRHELHNELARNAMNARTALSVARKQARKRAAGKIV